MPATEVSVNSSFVALIASESVSIVIPWLLLPPEVGVNRHGLVKSPPWQFTTMKVHPGGIYVMHNYSIECLSNTTVQEKYEQHSHMLPIGNGVIHKVCTWGLK